MAMLNAREMHKLGELLGGLGDVERGDKEGCHDYAFLEETIFPTLLPALVLLSENVEKQDMPPMPPAAGLPPNAKAFNPLRSLAELLVRGHPNGIFKKDTVYSQHLETIAAQRQQQRKQRELIIKEITRREEEAALTQALELTDKEEKEKIDIEARRLVEAEMKIEQRAVASATDAEENAGPFKKVLQLRETCMQIVNAFNFSNTQDTTDVSSLIYKETVRLLCTDSNASFVGIGDLDAPGLSATRLYYHTAADKKEFEVEEDEVGEPQEEEEEAEAKPAKEAPPPEITTRDLPPLDDEMALILKRGTGITWATVIDGEEHENEEGDMTRAKPKPKFVADAKFTEGMFFFEEKRSGTYLAVPIFKDSDVIGVICGDTLDSIIGSELAAEEVNLFIAASYIMQACLNHAEWCLLDARRKHSVQRLQSLVKDPRTLPAGYATAFVESMELLAPGTHVAVGMFDTDNAMRLVCNKAHDGTKTEDESVTAEDTRAHVASLFDAKTKREACLHKTENDEKVVSAAVPVMNANNLVHAVLYMASDLKAKPPHEDVIDFVIEAARLAQPILLAPAPNAMRMLTVLASSGIGDTDELYQTASLLCKRYTEVAEVFIACNHGNGGLRVLHQVGSKMDSVVARTEYSAVDEAMRTQTAISGSGFVAAPLVRKGVDGVSASFGCVALHSGELTADKMAAFEGVAAALSAALEVSISFVCGCFSLCAGVSVFCAGVFRALAGVRADCVCFCM